MTSIENNPDPNAQSKRNKIVIVIAAIVAISAIITTILVSTSTPIAVLGSQSHNKESYSKKDCTSYPKIPTDKTAQLDQAIQEAQDALETVDASLKPGEGTRLTHTGGFPLSSEGQSAIHDLSKAIDTAKKAKTNEAATDSNSKKGQPCPKEPNTADIDAAIKAIKDQTQSFISVRDAYRLNKATEDATTTESE